MLRAANSIYSPHFAVWPAKRSALERAVCHLAVCSDNNVTLINISMGIIAWFVVIFDINTTSDISNLSRVVFYPGFQRIFFSCRDWSRVNAKKKAPRRKKWGFFFSSALCASLTRLRPEPSVSTRKKYPLEPRVVVFMITYKSCYYLFILLPTKGL